MPTQKPANAGRNASFPIHAACSIAGISRLQTEAATITHSRCKSGQGALYGVAELSSHKENAGRAQRCAKKRNQNVINGLSHAVG